MRKLIPTLTLAGTLALDDPVRGWTTQARASPGRLDPDPD